MSERLRLIFAGTPEFAASHLQALLADDRHDIIAVYSQPDRPAGRGKKLKPSAVKQLALEHNIPVFQPLNFKEQVDRDALTALQADLMVVVAYGLILPKSILETPPLGCINVHASLLPRWRGAAPIQRAIEAGDAVTGVTIMQMDIGLDTGDMLSKAPCTIEANDTGGSLHDKLIAAGTPALLTVIEQLAAGTTQPEPQDDALSNYASKIDKDELLIDWQQAADVIARKIRAFSPFPITYTTLNGERLKLWQAEVINSEASKQVAGTISAVDRSGIEVCCGQGTIKLTVLQMPGGKALEVGAILNSKASLFQIGTVLGQS